MQLDVQGCAIIIDEGHNLEDVSGAPRSLRRSMLAEIYLCHACCFWS
eukprot:COSAG02_NODE_65759_length_257_cov_0.651899_1_plen_46_part_01